MNATMILNRAEELREELIENRRTLHSYAETGFDLPQTTAFVEKKLREYGLTPVRCGKAGNYFGIGMLIELYPQLALVNKRGAEAVGIFTYCGNDLAVHHFNKRKRFNVQNF